MQYTDVRKILKSFDGKHIPTEFARREAIARREFRNTRSMSPLALGPWAACLDSTPSTSR
jgi:hypothetical protein